ncbi:MAG: ATP-binding protein, partial [Chloroflexi bacterium]|nr:ATP-binding protein [Chloroflexota bacterium]
MPEKLLPATIRARVHEDAISRVTRFFNATTVETLNELFQNARRAGATKVDVTIADGEVRVVDNGRGIADPAALLAFGRTDWDAETARREDPAGMGVYSLARRAKVTIRSRPRPADGKQLPAWQVHLTPEHFLGHRIAPVEVIDAGSVAFGTEIVFDDDKANPDNVNSAARYFPLPVTCDSNSVERISFLHGAVHVEEWRGLRLGVHARQPPPGPH